MIDKNEFIRIKKEIDRYIKENLELKLQEPFKLSFNNCAFSNVLSFLTNRSLDDVLKHVDDTFQQRVFYHIDSKGLNEVEVYKRAGITKSVFSDIRSNVNYQPSRQTAIRMCFGLKLNLDEAKDLLQSAGMVLSHSLETDLIVEYFIKKQDYDYYNIGLLNEILYDYGLKTL